MTGKLDEKVALVTGGSRGIGAAIVRRLAAEGASVAFSYAASAEQAEALVREVQAQGRDAAAFQADQADPAQLNTLVAAVTGRWGCLDILVNCAGAAARGKVDDAQADVAALDRMFDVNVRGLAAAVRAAVPHMGEGGRVINIGSVLGDQIAFPGMADYAATKAAVAAFGRGWARDLGARGITVNTVQPGPIATDMNPEDGPSAADQRAKTALGRYGRPEEVAAAVAFLAGPDAGFITGTTLNVDGGFNA